MDTGSKTQKDVPEPDLSGAEGNEHGNGQENEHWDEELKWARRHMKEQEEPDVTAQGIAGIVQDSHLPRVERYAKNPGRRVVRKTGLRGQVPAPSPHPEKTRSITGPGLMQQGVPEAGAMAGRDKTCPVSGRKDLDFRSLLWMISELQFRIDDLEADVGDLKEGRGSG
jgi:hypothetical protein